MAKLKHRNIIAVAVACCILAIIIISLPSTIGELIGHKNDTDTIIAVQVIKTSTPTEPINTYYTESSTEIKQFLDCMGELCVGLPRFSANAFEVIAHPTVLYNVVIYTESGESKRFMITPEGKLYTRHAVFDIASPENIASTCSLAQEWKNVRND